MSDLYPFTTYEPPQWLGRSAHLPRKRWCGKSDRLGHCIRYYDWSTPCPHEPSTTEALRRQYFGMAR